MKNGSIPSLLFHILGFAIYFVADNMRIIIPGSSDTYGGRYKYFTVLNVYLSMGYLLYAVILDIKDLLTSEDTRPIDKDDATKVHKVRDYVFLSIIFPVSLTVSLLFWGIYSIEPELMLPSWKRKYIPINGFYNHAVHTAPFVIVLLECLIVHHRPPSTYMKGVTGWVCYATVYLCWILWIAYYADIWVYPFLKIMSNIHRVLFFLATFIFGGLLHNIALFINRKRWMNAFKSNKKSNKTY